jgi:acyl-CoA thioester hydrolase
MTHYPLKLKLRIDWSEMDLFGHVNNVSFFKYMQAARVNYWEVLGLSHMFEKTKMGPILASSQCDFKRPLFYPGNIVIQSGVESIGETSFCILHQILNEKAEIVAEGKDVVVLFDFNTNKKMSIPDSIREQVGELEKNC